MKLEIVFELLKNLVSRPMTVRFPHESIPIPQGYRGEHVYDATECISCALCAKICPNRAIEMVQAPEELREKYAKEYPRIDLGKCCFCALCQDICPKGCIELKTNVFLATFDPSVTIKSPFPTGSS
jgi:formate hydrogenlyase subunit 6/NADH:ubiquinone oxidoreductase subunit I